MSIKLKIGDIKGFEFFVNIKSKLDIGIVVGYQHDTKEYIVVLLDGTKLILKEGCDIKVSRVRLPADLRSKLETIGKLYIKGNRLLDQGKQVEGNKLIKDDNKLLSRLVTKKDEICNAKYKIENYLRCLLYRSYDSALSMCEMDFEDGGKIDISFIVGCTTNSINGVRLSDISNDRGRVHKLVKKNIGFVASDNGYITNFNESIKVRNFNGSDVTVDIAYRFVINTGYKDIVGNLNNILRDLADNLILKLDIINGTNYGHRVLDL